MIIEGHIKCDYSYTGEPCDRPIASIIITETYLESDNNPIEGTTFVCEQHGPEIMHEFRSCAAPDEPIWSINLSTYEASKRAFFGHQLITIKKEQ